MTTRLPPVRTVAPTTMDGAAMGRPHMRSRRTVRGRGAVPIPNMTAAVMPAATTPTKEQNA
ncbi:hypothetical protein GCM10011404_24880 [Sphingomonas prati]|nr:hypothetical protein GCM10011404_24880 [Sphingomonas prati]